MSIHILHRKRLITNPLPRRTLTGIAYMYGEHGKLEGHVCSDCNELMRDRMPTICGCRAYPFRQGSVMAEYKAGFGWRGHWQACGLWRLAYKLRRVEQLEMALED